MWKSKNKYKAKYVELRLTKFVFLNVPVFGISVIIVETPLKIFKSEVDSKRRPIKLRM